MIRPKLELKKKLKSVYFDEQLYEEIRRRAAERYVSASKYIVDAVLERMRREMKFEAQQEGEAIK